MELANLEPSVFAGLALVLGATLAALIFDLLKGNVECLREENAELRARKDERRQLAEFAPLAFRPGAGPPTPISQPGNQAGASRV